MMMLVPLVFATAPQLLVEAVNNQTSGTQLRLVDWWADDLDGDGKPEAIAELCDDEHGYFLVLHGSALMTAPLEIDGRNGCHVPPSRPAWHTATAGSIGQTVDVHHGSVSYAFAIRNDKLVEIATSSRGFDVDRTTGEQDDFGEAVDYDQLTYTHEEHGKRTHAALVVAGERSERSGQPSAARGDRSAAARRGVAGEGTHRATTIVGKTTISATNGEALTLHVHADRDLVVRECRDQPCTSTKVAKGDHDVAITSVDVDILASGSTYPVHVDTIQGSGDYPAPPTPW